MPGLPTPYYQDAFVTLYHADSLELAPYLEADAVVTDPPYGMSWDTDTRRFSGGGYHNTKRRGHGRAPGAVVGDTEPFDPSPWVRYPEVILWGSNHYAARLPVGTTLVWLKRYDDGFASFLSDAEVAWERGGHGVYAYRQHMATESRGRVHPTQKPLGLMRWCIGRTTGGVILDPYAGAGSTLVAAKSLGRRAIGVEVEERWCEAAAARLSQEVLGLDGGGSTPAEPEPVTDRPACRCGRILYLHTPAGCTGAA